MKYDGGKNATFRHIVNEMPPHRNFIELFLGSGAVMRNKLPAPVLNVGVEIKPQVAARAKSAMPTVDVVEGDAIKWLAHYDHRLSADTLVYADPPYLMITRSHKRPLYEYEFSEEHDHKRLLRFLLDTRAMVMVSGYRSDLYDAMLSGWRRVEFQATTHYGKKRVECLWCNFPKALQLHDYRYLGSNRTERQMLRRQQIRWQNRLLKMTALQRGALMSALADLRKPDLAATDRNCAISGSRSRIELRRPTQSELATTAGNRSFFCLHELKGVS